MSDTEEEELAAIDALPCDMRHEPPYPFAWCEVHDETFPVGEACKYQKINARAAARQSKGT